MAALQSCIKKRLSVGGSESLKDAGVGFARQMVG